MQPKCLVTLDNRKSYTSSQLMPSMYCVNNRKGPKSVFRYLLTSALDVAITIPKYAPLRIGLFSHYTFSSLVMLYETLMYEYIFIKYRK